MDVGYLSPDRLPPGMRALFRVRERMARHLEQLASGERITAAAVDPAGLALSESLRAQIGSGGQGMRNLNDGVSALQIAEGALDESSRLLARMRELSVQAQNGTLGESGREAIRGEFEALSGELSRIAAVTRFGDRALLDGSLEEPEALEIRDGSGEPVETSVEDRSAAALGVEGLDPADPATLDALDAAIGDVAASRASIGAAETRLLSSLQSRRVENESLSSAESRLRDADVAARTALLARDRVLEQAGIAARAHHRLDAASALQLLA